MHMAFWIRPGVPYGVTNMVELLHIVNCGVVSSGVSLHTGCLCRDWSELHLHVSSVLLLVE